jgi:hypothetical protein
MSETYEVNLLRNVHAVDSRSSVSKEFVGLKRKQVKDNRKRKDGHTAGRNNILQITGRGSYMHDAAEDEREGAVDITI